MGDDDNNHPAKWHWMDNDGIFQSMDDVVSQRIDDLKIGETMNHNTIYGQYELKILSKNKGQQRNTKTNNIREIRRMNTNQQKKYNINNHNNYKNKNNEIKNRNDYYNGGNDNDDDEKKENIEKWYWK